MSSMVFLGFSIIAFLISFSIAFYLIPMVMGSFFSIEMPTLTAEWQAKRDQIEDITQWVPPIAMMVGLFVFIVKALMAATTRGGS